MYILLLHKLNCFMEQLVQAAQSFGHVYTTSFKSAATFKCPLIFSDKNIFVFWWFPVICVMDAAAEGHNYTAVQSF